MAERPAKVTVEPVVTEEQLHKAEEFIEAEEGVHHKFAGAWGTFLFAVAVAMSLYHLYAAYGIVTTTTLRYVHVAFVLFLVFLLFPATRKRRNRFSWIDLICAIVGVATTVYALAGGDDFLDRSTAPNTIDMILGVALLVLVLEAARRSTGWIMPFICILFIVYAMAGPHLPPPWTHRGYDVARLVGTMYMTLEGIFGTPVDVSSSLIILFTIYGAFLQYSNAGTVLYRLLARCVRPQGDGCRPCSDRSFIPTGRTVRIRRGHDGNARHRCLSDACKSRL